MVKIFSILMISLLFIGCFKTEYGKSRPLFSKKNIKNIPDSIYNYIDTTKVYLYTDSFNYNHENINKYYSQGYIKTLKLRNQNIYMKFYKNGKVGTYFIDKNKILTKEDFNPKKSILGYYFYEKNNIILKGYSEHPQNSGFYKNKIEILYNQSIKLINLNIKNDDLIKYKEISYYSIFKPISIPKEWLIYKPDW